MTVQGVITKQWQIYLPQGVRRKLGLERPVKVSIKVENGKLVVRPIKSRFLQLVGILSGITPKKKINFTKIRKYIDYTQI